MVSLWKVFIKFCWHDEKFIIDPKVLACEGTRFNLTDVMNTGKKMIVILQLLSFFIITYWFGWNRTISTCKLSSTPNKTYELIVIQRPYTLSSMTSPLLHSQSNGDFCQKNLSHNGILVPKLFWPTVRKNSSSDRKKQLLKFEAEGREFAKILRSLEQFIQTVKGQNNFW